MPDATQEDVDDAVVILKNSLDFVRRELEIDTENLKTSVGEIQKRLSENRQFAAAVQILDSISDSVSLAAQAYYAGQKGDAIGTASYSLTAVAGVTKGAAAALMTAGPAGVVAGIVVAVVAAIIDIVATILGLFRQKEQALIDQIAALLIHERSKELQAQLVSAAHQLQDWEELLDVRPWKAKSWTELMTEYHLRTGAVVTFCDQAAVWLLTPEHQDHTESWVDVFEAYASCMWLRGMVYFSQWASWVKYAQLKLDAGADKATLEPIDEQASTEMKQYFEHVTNTFRNLHWLGRRMAPIWHRGQRSALFKALVSFLRPDAHARTTSDNGWSGIGNHHFDQFAVLPRNERAEGGEVVWTWENTTKWPGYRINNDWYQFTGFGDNFDIVSMDVAFLGDSEPPKPANREATPQPWTGVDVLLALERKTNKLHVKYFAPEQRLDYDALPKNAQNKFILPSTLSTAPKLGAIGAIRQVRVRVLPDRTRPHAYSVHAYLLGTANNKDQVYRVTDQHETPTPYGAPIDPPVQKIYVNDAAVWAITGKGINRGSKDIWYRAHDAADTAPWTRVTSIPEKFGTWDIADIHPGEDGLLIACVWDTYFGYTPEDGWQRSEADRGENGWGGDEMARLPLDGFRMFNAAWQSALAWKELADSTKIKWIESYVPKKKVA